MRLLDVDRFERRRGFPKRRRSGVTLFVFAVLALALLALSRIDHPGLRQVRSVVFETVTPVLRAIVGPLAPLRRLGEQVADYATLSQELERVRLENQSLKSWEARAKELERRLADLEALVKVVDEPKLDFVTGRVIADAKGPFARSVLIDVGRSQGVKSGFPVISADGLVGRLLETGSRASRVLLLTDYNSRVPVLIGDEDVRAILVGDNSGEPRLAHLPATAVLRAGDDVVTSGVGGLFPRGLRIGRVVESDLGPRVKPAAKLEALEHLSVLFADTGRIEEVGEAAVDTPQTSARRGSEAKGQ